MNPHHGYQSIIKALRGKRGQDFGGQEEGEGRSVRDEAQEPRLLGRRRQRFQRRRPEEGHGGAKAFLSTQVRDRISAGVFALLFTWFSEGSSVHCQKVEK